MSCLEYYLDVHVRSGLVDGNVTRQNRSEAHAEFEALKKVFGAELPNIGHDIESFLSALRQKRAADIGLSDDSSWREIEQAMKRPTRKKSRK